MLAWTHYPAYLAFDMAAETKKKSFACNTAGTPFQSSITRVWVDCAGAVWGLIVMLRP